MQLPDAIKLISKIQPTVSTPQTWADLGAGKGLFSNALLSVLPGNSKIFAVDKQDTLQGTNLPTQIIFQQADFEIDPLPFRNLDGILLANSLHYISDQLSCIIALKEYLRPQAGKFVIIEYDTGTANQWVPFPISYQKTKQLFNVAGFSHVEKIGERPSIYRSSNIYAALITK